MPNIPFVKTIVLMVCILNFMVLHPKCYFEKIVFCLLFGISYFTVTFMCILDPLVRPFPNYF